MGATNAELVARIATLEDEAEIARRLAAFEDHGTPRERIYRFIEIEAANFAIAMLCRVAKFARSAYDAWVARGEGPSEALVEEAHLAKAMFELWADSRRRYGVPKVTAALWRMNRQVNAKKVSRIMGELGIVGICGRRKLHTTWRDPSHTLAPVLVLLDEAAKTPLPKLPQWASTLTGAGIQLVTVWQSKAQLDTTYGKDAETVLTNDRSKLIHRVASPTSPPPSYVSELIGDEDVRSDLNDRGWNVRPHEPKTGRSPGTALPYLPASVLRRAAVGDALLVHGHLPPAWIRAPKRRSGRDHRRSAHVYPSSRSL